MVGLVQLPRAVETCFRTRYSAEKAAHSAFGVCRCGEAGGVRQANAERKIILVTAGVPSVIRSEFLQRPRGPSSAANPVG